jgi:hypothetical protein
MTENNKQVQKAGDNSQQIQAGVVHIYQGITEQRAHEICLQTAKKVIEENTTGALEIANQRLNAFEGVLIPRIQKIEADFNSFSDPAFQILLKKAQLTAACTERNDDYKILSELLVHRVKNKSNIKKKAIITKAVEILDQIDDDSLLALSVFLTMDSFIPTSGSISKGLKVISDVYEKFDLDMLPNGYDWIDNLSILGALTVSRIEKLRKFEDYFSDTLSGYVCAGIKKDSDDYAKAKEILAEGGIKIDFLVDHELVEGYVRLPLVDKEQINTLILNDDEKDAVGRVFDMYSKNSDTIFLAKSKFVEMLNSYPSINKAMKWWSSIQPAISLTSVGRVIGHANAKSIDPSLPDLDKR